MAPKTPMCLWVLVHAVGAAVLAEGAAALGKPCCGPDQWEATVFEQDAAFIRSQDRATYQTTINKLSYDYRGLRTALQIKVLNQSDVTNTYSVILDFKQGQQWVISGKYCTKAPLPINMTSPCVPDDATSLGSRLYGGVAASTWVYRANNVTSRVTVSDEGCYPLAQSEVTTGDVWRLNILNYQNITEGIKDPMVFKVPAICHNATIIKPLFFNSKGHSSFLLHV